MIRCIYTVSLIAAALFGGTLRAGADSSVTLRYQTRPSPPPQAAQPAPPQYYVYPDGSYYYPGQLVPTPQYVQPQIIVPPLIARPVTPLPRILRITRHGIFSYPDPRFHRWSPPYPDFQTNGYAYFPQPYPYVNPNPNAYIIIRPRPHHR
ncbi:MAG: hypothetical protein ACYDBB_14260 [Armatimonadota bacterium]